MGEDESHTYARHLDWSARFRVHLTSHRIQTAFRSNIHVNYKLHPVDLNRRCASADESRNRDIHCDYACIPKGTLDPLSYLKKRLFRLGGHWGDRACLH